MNRSPLQRLHLPPLKIAGRHSGALKTQPALRVVGVFCQSMRSSLLETNRSASRVRLTAPLFSDVQSRLATLVILPVAPFSQGQARLPKRQVILLRRDIDRSRVSLIKPQKFSLFSGSSLTNTWPYSGRHCLAHRHLHKHCVSERAFVTKTLAEVGRTGLNHASAQAQKATCDYFSRESSQV